MARSIRCGRCAQPGHNKRNCPEADDSLRTLAFDYLQDAYTAERRLPSVRDIARGIGCSLGAATKLRREFFQPGTPSARILGAITEMDLLASVTDQVTITEHYTPNGIVELAKTEPPPKPTLAVKIHMAATTPPEEQAAPLPSNVADLVGIGPQPGERADD